MRRFSKIKKFIFFFNFKFLVSVVLIILTLLITYSSYFKYKNFVLEQFILYKDRFFYGSKEKRTPNLIISGEKLVDSKSLLYELNKKLNSTKKKTDLVVISNILKKKELIKKFVITNISHETITINIEERKIIGLFKIKNKNYLIDEYNNLITGKITSKLSYLPTFIGENANKNANVILRLVNESDINLNYISFSFIKNRRWNINLNNGVKILLPENNVLDTLKLLKKIDLKYDILKGNFVEIDLRINGKFFLKPKIN